MHSTETALLKVSNDHLQVLDTGSHTVLVLLDLRAAFDTIDLVSCYIGWKRWWVFRVSPCIGWPLTSKTELS